MITNFEFPNGAGIYKLTCVNNDKVYIGKSVNLYKRLCSHKNCEAKSKGKSVIHNAILKYGWESFKIEILEVVEDFDKLKDNSKLLEREEYYIELFDSTNKDNGYNICKFSTDCTGKTLTEDHKNKIRNSNLGRPKSESTKEKIRKRMMGNTYWLGISHSDETKEKMRKSALGKIISDDVKDKMRQAKLGKTLTEEHKDKIRQSMLKNKSNDSKI